MKGFDAVLIVLVGCSIGFVFGAEYGKTDGRQSVEAVACEPKCEFVYRGTKLINVTCPDSTGRIP